MSELRQTLAATSQKANDTEQKARELQRSLTESKEQALKEKEASAKAIEVAKLKLERTFTQASVELCNAYVQKESLRHGAFLVGQVTSRISASEKGKRLLFLVKKDFANYISVGELMVVEWVRS